MQSLWDKIIREARSVSLTKEERDLMLTNIRNSMREHNSHASNINTNFVKSPYLYHFRFGLSLHEKRFVPVAVLLIMVIFGGTSFAANFALPGEALYGMKVNVNEEMESWIALTPNANARFESVKADRRLKEVEKLTVKKKKITPKAKAQIKQNFAKNAEKVKQIVAEIEANGDANEAAKVKAEFENKLEAHSVVLSKLSSDEDAIIEIDDEGKNDIKEINAMVDEHIDDLKTEEGSEISEGQDKNTSDSGDKKEEESTEVAVPKTETKSDKAESEDKKDKEDSKSTESLYTDSESETKVEDSIKVENKSKESLETKNDKEESKKKEDQVKVEVKNILKELELEVEVEVED